MSKAELTLAELKQAATTLASALESLNVSYGIIGGAGVALVTDYYGKGSRSTSDIDLVVTGDAMDISKKLIKINPQQWGSITEYGVSTPTIKIRREYQDETVEVEVEVFDYGT